MSVASFWGNSNLWAAGVKVRISGIENIDKRGPYVFISNHQGWFDIFAVLGKLPLPFSWLAKVELFKIPILGQAMQRAGYISIDRGDRRKAIESLNRAAEVIQQGTSVFIFPEGTRSADGVLRDFKKGGFVLAQKSGQPIVPVSISGSYLILPKDSWMIHPGVIRFHVGRPILCSGPDSSSRDLLMSEVREAIRSGLTPEEAGPGPEVEPEVSSVLSRSGGGISRDL
jgi:1-acyl-sn-glycerol-3-phosphate acyltransferase